MGKTKKHQQLLLLEHIKAAILDKLSEDTRIPKQALLREAVDDLLSLNGRLDPPTARVREVRNALKKARAQLVAYRREIEQTKCSDVSLRNCLEAIAAIDRAREEFGD
jgi:hypothetical protein